MFIKIETAQQNYILLSCSYNIASHSQVLCSRMVSEILEVYKLQN